MAQEQNGWQVDSLGSESDSTRPDVQRVYEVVVKMLDRWNAHDIEGHLESMRLTNPTYHFAAEFAEVGG